MGVGEVFRELASEWRGGLDGVEVLYGMRTLSKESSIPVVPLVKIL